MGWEAQVWGFGPFTEDIVDDLPYSNDMYADIEPGTVVSGLVGQMPSNSMSISLADALGVEVATMEWEVNKDKFDVFVISDLKLDEGTNENSRSILEVVDRVERLLDHGWRLFFDPNC